ncbi:MAG: DUF2029 domain-containing protein [Acidobacteriota bacterium]|nr:DUF2029 domain-containing protein [Acidobacteriota bacterium]
MSRALRIASTVAAALAVIYAIAVTWRQHERAAGLDFYIYFVNAQLAGREDVPNIYDRDAQSRIGEEYYERAQRGTSELRKFDAKRRRFLDSVSSPFLYTSLSWVSRDYDRALQQYHLLVFAAFIIGYLLIARFVRLSWPSALFLLAALLLWYRGFEADLRVGNVNSLQLLMLGASLWCPPLLAGAIAGLLIAFKPNLILIPLLLAVARMASRDWRRLRLEIFGGAIGGAIAFLAAAIHYGSFAVWLQWIARANEFYHRLPTRTERNVTPFLTLFHEHGAWPSYVLALLLTIAAIIAIWRGRSRDDAMIAGVAILIYLLSATVVWLHYMVLVIPIALALLRWRMTAVVALLALAAIAQEPFEWLTGIAVYPNDAKLIGPALCALFVCALWKMVSRAKVVL